MEHGLTEVPTVPGGAFDAPRYAGEMKFNAIFKRETAKVGSLLDQCLKVAGIALGLFLVMPVLLLLSVVAVVVARLLGVPLFAPSPFRIR